MTEQRKVDPRALASGEFGDTITTIQSGGSQSRNRSRQTGQSTQPPFENGSDQRQQIQPGTKAGSAPDLTKGTPPDVMVNFVR